MAKSFVHEFNEMMEMDDEFEPPNLYNMSQTSVCWKGLPRKAWMEASLWANSGIFANS